MNTKTLKTLAEHTASWPNVDKQELLDYARVMEARRTGRYVVTEAEHVALSEGMDEAERGMTCST